MKIFGVGNDVVEIFRFKKILNKKNNNKIKNRLFSKTEIKSCKIRKKNMECFAKRFAAKEAFSKSLGTGISKGLNFNEIEVKNDNKRKPYLNIKGESLKVTKKILKKKKFKTFLSLSDDNKYAFATVILTV